MPAYVLSDDDRRYQRRVNKQAEQLFAREAAERQRGQVLPVLGVADDVIAAGAEGEFSVLGELLTATDRKRTALNWCKEDIPTGTRCEISYALIPGTNGKLIATPCVAPGNSTGNTTSESCCCDTLKYLQATESDPTGIIDIGEGNETRAAALSRLIDEHGCGEFVDCGGCQIAKTFAVTLDLPLITRAYLYGGTPDQHGGYYDLDLRSLGPAVVSHVTNSTRWETAIDIMPLSTWAALNNPAIVAYDEYMRLFVELVCNQPVGLPFRWIYRVSIDAKGTNDPAAIRQGLYHLTDENTVMGTETCGWRPLSAQFAWNHVGDNTPQTYGIDIPDA